MKTTKCAIVARMKTSSRFIPATAPLRRWPSCLLFLSHRKPAALALAALVLSGAAGARAADKNKKQGGPTIAAVRIAQGQVVNGAKSPVEGAVVYLENPTSLEIKSYLTDNNGHFHFTQLAPQTDYEVWAEQNGVESKHKFISQFNSHTHYDFTLKLTPEKKRLLGFL